MPNFLVAILIFLSLLAPSASALEIKTTEPNWKEMALENLTKSGQAINEQQLMAHRSLRCIKMNNYFCLMQSSESNPWKGSTGWDSAGHSVFSDPVWSVRGIVRDTCSKHRSSLNTAIEIASKYSPWCDTLGTKAVNGTWGRSCPGGPQPPANFNGPLCKAPANNVPAPGQCNHCNCPSSIARVMVMNTGLSIDSDLELFLDSGAVNVERMTIYLSNLAFQETGLRPKEELILAGIEAAGICSK